MLQPVSSPVTKRNLDQSASVDVHTLRSLRVSGYVVDAVPAPVNAVSTDEWAV